MRPIHIVLLAATAAAGASIAGAVMAEDVYVGPDWLKRPRAAMLRSVWPSEAMKRGLGGKAVLACKVSVQGVLFGCEVDREEPTGSNFGAAAIMMTPQLLMKPATLNGKPVVGFVRLPITFKAGAPSSVEGGPDGSKRVLPATMAWPRAPSHADVVAAYPGKARAAGIGGLAAVQCDFGSNAVPRDCQVMREEPKGYGFGAAAKALTSKFQGPDALPDGTPIRGAMVQLPFTFSPDMLRGAEPVVGKANWAKAPSLEALRASFPKAPVGSDTVRVRLNCRVEQGGGVSGCKVEYEEPAGQGYGAGVLALAGEFRLSTWTMEGLPAVGSSVTIPVRYQFTAPAAPAMPSAAKP